MPGENKKYNLLKFALLGDAAIGKTSLIDKYTQHWFREDYKPNFGVNIMVKKLELWKKVFNWKIL